MKKYYVWTNNSNGTRTQTTIFAKNRKDLKKKVKNIAFSEIRTEYGFKMFI